MNIVVLSGRLTKDPVVSRVGLDGMVARFSLAVRRPTKEDAADFPQIVAWGRQAEFAEKYLHKGNYVEVTGKLRTGSYEKNGQKVYTTEVWADSLSFAGPKETTTKENTEPAPITDVSGFMSIPDDIDEELPFK